MMTTEPTTTPQRKRRPPKETFGPRPSPDAPDAPQRLFLAVPLPAEVIDHVDTVTRSLQEEGWPVRWAAAGNAHITLHFLGNVEPERAQLLRLALPPVIAAHERFPLRTADLGVFPNMKRPRVIWLGLYGPAHRLNTLRDSIGETLASLEFAIEQTEFHPHITLGRVRDGKNTRVRDLPASIRARLEQAAATGEVTHKRPLPVPVDEVLLIRSHLGPEGPRYEVIERFPLAPDRA